MAKKEKSTRSGADHDDHLIKLQINQDLGSQAWTKFMIAVQGGLGGAFAYILLSERQLPLNGVKTALVLIVALFGILTSAIIGKIIKRHHQWSAWYINKYGLLPGNEGLVFPVPKKPFVATKIDEVEPGVIGGLMVSFCTVTAIGWCIAASVVFVLSAVPTHTSIDQPTHSQTQTLQPDKRSTVNNAQADQRLPRWP
jgi:hypothetical protein